MQDMIISCYVNHEESASYISHRCFKIICYWIIYRYRINIITLTFFTAWFTTCILFIITLIFFYSMIYNMHTVYFCACCRYEPFVCPLMVWIVQKNFLCMTTDNTLHSLLATIHVRSVKMLTSCALCCLVNHIYGLAY